MVILLANGEYNGTFSRPACNNDLILTTPTMITSTVSTPTFVLWPFEMRKCSRSMLKAHFHGKIAMCEIDCAYCSMAFLQLGW